MTKNSIIVMIWLAFSCVVEVILIPVWHSTNGILDNWGTSVIWWQSAFAGFGIWPTAIAISAIVIFGIGLPLAKYLESKKENTK